MSDRPRLRSVLATDCGSTTTKAILIELVDGQYRQTWRGEAPTTVEAPFEDVTNGVLNAAQEVQELSGRKLVRDDGAGIVTPEDDDGNGVDAYISTSSAGGGLQVVVGGVVRGMSAESAMRAALGAGAIVMDTFATNDKRRPHEQIERIRQLRPDMILLAGGVDGGTVKHVVAMAERIAAARPRTRLGGAYNLPVIYAGNIEVQDLIRDLLQDLCALEMTDNVRPVMESENLDPARDKIHDLFMEHVMAQAPGYPKLMEWTDADIMPTPGAVGLIMQTIARQRGINVLGVDIGGATTDVFSVFDGHFNRTVSANLGMSYSVSNVLAEAGLPMILRWVPFSLDEKGLRNRIGNKMIRPTTIPETLEELKVEQAIAREALRLAFIQHREFAVGLKGVQKQRTIADAFRQTGDASLVQMMQLDLLVGSGGVLSHAPRRVQSMRMMIDAFAPEGVTELAVDSIFMMPHLGVLSTVQEDAATEVFERDCMVYLGTCVAPIGALDPRSKVLKVQFTLPDGTQVDTELGPAELSHWPLTHDETVTATLTPLQRSLDVGAGPGKTLKATLKGGEVGIVVDTRGRPIQVPDDPATRVPLLEKWVAALDEYPAEGELMAAIFTPGLKVTDHTIAVRDRRLPIEGEVLVKVGDVVMPDQVVARTDLPGKIYPVNVANQLGVDPGRLGESMKVKAGDAVTEGQMVAETDGIFGFFKGQAFAPLAGTIESVSSVTGQVIYQAAPIPVEVDAYIHGRVVEVIEGEGCVVQSPAALVQGIFGLGGEVKAALVVAVEAPTDVLEPALLKPEHRGKIVIGGAYVTLQALQRAIELGVAGVVTGGFDYDEIKELLGYEVGVAITGGEDLGLTLIVTEGFGHIQMAPATFELLSSKAGQQASINGATQIRAGVIRPEVVVTYNQEDAPADKVAAPEPVGIQLGDPVRGIRAPWFGRLGEVKSLPVEPIVLPSGSKARVMEVAFEDGVVAMLPRSNVEVIER